VNFLPLQNGHGIGLINVSSDEDDNQSFHPTKESGG